VRVTTAIVWLRDILNRGETNATAKKLKAVTKVISGRTDEGGGCEQALPEMTAALAECEAPED
jgi:hypothetical protein